MPVIPTPDDLAAALSRHERQTMAPLPDRTNHLPTGVLVPLLWAPEPICLVTVRSAGMRQHAGEVCFPGGRPEAGDRDLRETALREAREELGIAGARVLGELSSVPLYTSDYRLHPFVAAVAERPAAANANEVARVIEIDLGEQVRRGAIEAIVWTHGGTRALSPVFPLDGAIMYGATAHVFYELVAVAAGLFGVPVPPLVAGKLDWADVMR